MCAYAQKVAESLNQFGAPNILKRVIQEALRNPIGNRGTYCI